MNLKNVKSCVFGIQGSGKTYFVENFIIPNFKNPFVYRIHREDFIKTKKNVLVYDGEANNQELEVVAKKVIQFGKEKKIDVFILDETDLFLKNIIAVPKNMTDLILNHRHYNLALIFISRRPQSIPTEIVESCENIITFKIEGENVERKFKAIHPDFPALLSQLDKDKHNFILKELGKAPKIYDAVEIEDSSHKRTN